MYDTDHEQWQADAAARAFKPNPEMENVDRMQRERPDAYDALGPAMHTQLGLYRAMRDAAKGGRP